MKRIQKKFQGTVPENKILNTFSDSLTDTYSCNKINELVNSASGGVGVEQDPTVPEYVKNITKEQIEKWDSLNSGAPDYEELPNKPKINNVELSGNKTLDDLGIQPKGTYVTSETDPVFVASPAYKITEEDIKKWNTPQEIPGGSISYNIGDVLITGTNIGADEMANRYGGTWELIDKEFSHLIVVSENDTYFSPGSVSSHTIGIARKGHSLYTRFRFVNSSSISDNEFNIGTLELGALGVSNLSFSKYQNGHTDGGNGMFMAQLSDTGELKSVDVIGKTSSATISSGNTCYVEFTHIISMSSMLDSACNKFYWKKLT